MVNVLIKLANREDWCRYLAKRQRLSLRFIHLPGRMVALAVSANRCALNLTVGLIVAHFHRKRFTA